ncbi:MAG: type III ribulose-bisphosphate carboxylase [Candidatus Aenigmarchaeota archaeon]|nr:type III ribulose-bisphosphate carboxylase [Candidatus Aenigmarchaeota archaeon]
MVRKFEWYTEFVDLDYKPSKRDLICLFRVEPAKGISMKEAAGRVASESSVGTWTTLSKLPRRIQKIKARVFEIKGNYVRIAYPPDLFEPYNMPQILSSIAGNIFGMKAVKNLRLEDVWFPRKLAKSFKGPQFGIKGIRKVLRVKKRPILASVPKPKVGFSAKEHAEVAYKVWKGGIDLVKDDENLASLSFNKFEKRVELLMKMREKVEKETGEKKFALINITAGYREMEKRAKLVAEYGNEYVMVDIVTTGFAALQSIREVCEDFKLAIHAHRAMHASFTRNKKHGISMLVLAKFSRIVGVDQIHTGTAGIGKLESGKETILINEFLRSEFYGIKRVFPVCSGGLHPGVLPQVMKTLGTDLVIQVGGGVFGHPKGAEKGARAVRQAVEAYVAGVSLKKFAEDHEELKEALEKWGFVRPR